MGEQTWKLFYFSYKNNLSKYTSVNIGQETISISEYRGYWNIKGPVIGTINESTEWDDWNAQKRLKKGKFVVILEGILKNCRRNGKPNGR